MGAHLGICAAKQPLRNMVAATLFIIWVLQTPPTMAQVDTHAVSANDLVRAVINHELQQSTADRSRWTYEVETNEGDQQRTKRVVETPNGSVERLIAVNGQEPNTKEQQAETKRIEEFVNSSQEQERANRTQQKDTAHSALSF